MPWQIRRKHERIILIEILESIVPFQYNLANTIDRSTDIFIKILERSMQMDKAITNRTGHEIEDLVTNVIYSGTIYLARNRHESLKQTIFIINGNSKPIPFEITDN